MEKKTLDILAEAISDVGSWQWWYEAENMLQLEFCDVMLYDETTPEKGPHSSVLALRFFGKPFAVFLDDREEDGEKTWIERFIDDEIAAFPLDAYELVFNDPEYARSVLEAYPHQTPMKDYIGPEAFSSAGCLLAGKCGDVGCIVGGDELAVVGKNGKYREEELEPAIKKWWEYWKDYWRKRKTRDAYEKDWACETTIPADRNDPQGNW